VDDSSGHGIGCGKSLDLIVELSVVAFATALRHTSVLVRRLDLGVFGVCLVSRICLRGSYKNSFLYEFLVLDHVSLFTIKAAGRA
jgi:hypothetical protein